MLINYFLLTILFIIFSTVIYVASRVLFPTEAEKDMFRRDKQPGAVYKGYVNLTNGRMKIVPSRVSEEYMLNVFGMIRHPVLDYVIR